MKQFSQHTQELNNESNVFFFSFIFLYLHETSLVNQLQKMKTEENSDLKIK